MLSVLSEHSFNYCQKCSTLDLAGTLDSSLNHKVQKTPLKDTCCKNRTPWRNFLQILHGHDVAFDFYIAILKSLIFERHLISFSASSQIFRARNPILSVPLKTVLTEWIRKHDLCRSS